MNEQKLDSNEQIYFERELQKVKAQSYDILFPELKARTLLPTDFSAGPGAETIKYEQYEEVGFAKIVNNYAKDFPRADIKGKELVSIVKSLGASYGYNVQEIRAAAMANKNLQQRRANAAKRAIMQQENTIALFGDAENNIPGFLSNPNVNTGTVPADGSGSTTQWQNKTPDQIIRDICLVLDTASNNTKDVEISNTLLLPVEKFNLISCKRIDDTNITILNFIKGIRPGIEIISLFQLADGEYPVSLGFTGNLIVAYNRNPDKITLEIPQDFEQFAPQQELLDFVVPVHERIGGVLIYYPLSVTIYDGI